MAARPGLTEGFKRFLERRFPRDPTMQAAVRQALFLLQPKPATEPTRRVYILAVLLESDRPIGGAKMLYRHVDLLNRNGIPAAVVHMRPGFRYTWFENETVVRYLTVGLVNTSDFLVVPEVVGPCIADIGRGARKVIYNQNCYYSFLGYSLEPEDQTTPYRDPEVTATLVVSEDSRRYLEYAFPGLRILRIRYSVRPDLFFWDGAAKKRQIAFMPRKGVEDLVQVLNILKFRGMLHGFSLVPIEGLPEREVAAILRDSAIYLSTGQAEGFGLPVAEAMACGCTVVGYHGGGGRELFRPGFSHPVEEGDILGLARACEQVIQGLREEPARLEEQGREAAEFIRREYSPEAEERSIVETWREIRDGDPAAVGGEGRHGGREGL
jgi:glycosyltransferase involved in cell wall biosynthesis